MNPRNGIVKFNQLIKKLDVVIFGSSIDGFVVCENNPDYCFAINFEFNVHIFQQLSRDFDFIPIVLSTDAVYSGLAERLLTEDFTPTPLSVYGKSKRMFEVHILENSKRPCVVRMSKLWGDKKCFIPQLAARLTAGETLFGISDQYFRPLNIFDAAGAIEHIIFKEITGVLHISGPELLSWYSVLQRLFGHSNSQIIQKSYQEVYNSDIRPKRLNLLSSNELILPIISKFKIIGLDP